MADTHSIYIILNNSKLDTNKSINNITNNINSDINYINYYNNIKNKNKKKVIIDDKNKVQNQPSAKKVDNEDEVNI